MRVLLVDDHSLFRVGLKNLLESDKSIEIVGEACDGFEAVALTEKTTPDVVVMDIAMPELNGLEAANQIRERVPGTKIIILSRHTDNMYVDQALKSGASAYVHKDAAFEELKLALDAVTKDRYYISPTVMKPVISGYLQLTPANGAMASYNKLTTREKEVFHLLAVGRRRKEIAETLRISPKTVDRHRTNLLEKLNLCQEAEIAEFAKLIG